MILFQFIIFLICFVFSFYGGEKAAKSIAIVLTIFTFIAVFASWLIILQIGTILLGCASGLFCREMYDLAIFTIKEAKNVFSHILKINKWFFYSPVLLLLFFSPMTNEDLKAYPRKARMLASINKPIIKPSFACDKDNSSIEKIICGDSDLSQLDVTLHFTYTQKLKHSENPSSLTEDQQGWILERNKCRHTDCIKEAYVTRINSLLKNN